MSHAGDERRYVRAVESAWSKVLGRAALVSPREFETIDAWRRRGIPLSVVLEVVEASGKRRSGGSPKSLTALARAVEEAWSAVSGGRAAPEAAGLLPARSDARRAWQEACRRSGEGAPLHALLTRLLADEAAGSSAPALDAALDDALPGAVSDAALAQATDETGRALGAYRRRVSEEEFQKMFARALTDRLRAVVGLPRLALTR